MQLPAARYQTGCRCLKGGAAVGGTVGGTAIASHWGSGVPLHFPWSSSCRRGDYCDEYTGVVVGDEVVGVTPEATDPPPPEQWTVVRLQMVRSGLGGELQHRHPVFLARLLLAMQSVVRLAHHRVTVNHVRSVTHWTSNLQLRAISGE